MFRPFYNRRAFKTALWGALIEGGKVMDDKNIIDSDELTEKLYSPLNFYIRYDENLRNSEYDEISFWRDEITHAEAFDYMDNMKALLAWELQYTSGRGMMDYCAVGRLPEKVQSLKPDVEVQGDKIWFVANIKLNKPLTYSDMLQLKEWWLGQLSDGLGESLEQREMKVGSGEFYMEPWTASKDFFIDTQEEFNERMGLDKSKDMDAANTQPDTKLSISNESDVLIGISAESEKSSPLPDSIIENIYPVVHTTTSVESDRPVIQATVPSTVAVRLFSNRSTTKIFRRQIFRSLIFRQITVRLNWSDKNAVCPRSQRYNQR
jgi:hypothetical protein